MTAVNPTKANLISWWKLDETSGTRYDAHGSNNLSDINTVGYATGKKGNAADFELSNSEHLKINDNASLSFGNESFTCVAWVKFESVDANPTKAILSKWEWEKNKREYELAKGYGRQKFTFKVSQNGTTENEVIANTFGDVSAGVWYFVAGVHDSVNDKLTIYVNDKFDSVSYSSGCNDNTSPFAIGAEFASGTAVGYFDGLIDEAAMWRRALTADEISWLYNSGSGRTYEDLFPIKTINGIDIAKVKTINGVDIGKVKSIWGIQ